jgi:hypothetical protein
MMSKLSVQHIMAQSTRAQANDVELPVMHSGHEPRVGRLCGGQERDEGTMTLTVDIATVVKSRLNLSIWSANRVRTRPRALGRKRSTVT